MQPQRDGDRHDGEHREGAPGVTLQRVDHHHRQPGHRHRDDKQHGKAGAPSCHRAKLGLGHFGKREPAQFHRGEQRHRVVHCAADHRTGEQPDKTGEEPELRRQHRADQRAGCGDGREMLAGIGPFAGGYVVLAVFIEMRRRRLLVVYLQYLLNEKNTVIAIGDRQNAQRRQNVS